MTPAKGHWMLGQCTLGNRRTNYRKLRQEVGLGEDSSCCTIEYWRRYELCTMSGRMGLAFRLYNNRPKNPRMSSERRASSLRAIPIIMKSTPAAMHRIPVRSPGLKSAPNIHARYWDRAWMSSMQLIVTCTIRQ